MTPWTEEEIAEMRRLRKSGVAFSGVVAHFYVNHTRSEVQEAWWAIPLNTNAEAAAQANRILRDIQSGVPLINGRRAKGTWT